MYVLVYLLYLHLHIHLGFGFLGDVFFFGFYHGQSLLNHHLGNIVRFVQASKKQIQVNR